MSRECEAKLGTLLNNPIPHNTGDFETFLNQKRNLSIELNHLRLIEDHVGNRR